MEKQSRTDLIIVASALAGVATAELARSKIDRVNHFAGDQTLVMPALVGTISLTRRGGRMVGLYPTNVAVLAVGAFALGLGLGLVSRTVGALMPPGPV